MSVFVRCGDDDWKDDSKFNGRLLGRIGSSVFEGEVYGSLLVDE